MTVKVIQSLLESFALLRPYRFRETLPSLKGRSDPDKERGLLDCKDPSI